MATPEAGLGISVNFDPATFRNGIKFSMQMGAAPDPNKRPKFVKASTTKTYWKNGVRLATPPRQGRDGQPLDPDIEVREGTPTVVTDADCAIEIERVDRDELPVGNFRDSKAVVTFLDVDYAKVQGCQEMHYNGDVYVYGYEPEIFGMFEVSVHTIIYYCRDDS